MDRSAHFSAQYTPRPGEPPRVSPEGLIYGTDGKCRWVSESAGLFRSSPRCLLFTMDERTISIRQVKGRVRRQDVVHAFSVWVGGQSQPSLRFKDLRTVQLSGVKSITLNPDKKRIRLGTGWSSFSICAEPEQFEPILAHLSRACPQAPIPF